MNSKMEMMEKQVEARLMKSARALGGVALKMTPQASAGWPDRLVLLPGGRMAFVELKRPGGKARLLQKARHEALRALGFRVEVVDNAEAAEALVYAL